MQAMQARANSLFNRKLDYNGQAAMYQKRIKDMQTLQSSFNTMTNMSGKWATTSVVGATAVDKYTDALKRQRVTWKQLISDQAIYKKAVQEQIALQNAQVVSWGKNSQGKIMSSVLVPKNYLPTDFTSRMKAARIQVGMFGAAMESAGRAGGEWARGLQRTGFQITQGIGLPLAALAAVAGVTAYKVDQALTAIGKVYDTEVDKSLTGNAKIMAQQQQIDQIKAQSVTNAKTLASTYGTSVMDTLNAEQALAASGMRGVELMKATNETQRAAILGDLDQQTAIKTTIALQSTYNMSTKELADTWNYFNQIENQTSLSMQDITDAVPKILPQIKALGGSVKDAGLLLVAMKAGGVDAVEGANALKSGLGGLIRPTTVTTKALAAMGVEISDIPRTAGGDMIRMLQIFQQRISGLDKVGQQNAFYRLFGKEQAARMQILVQQLGNITDAESQVGRAAEAGRKSTLELSAAADAEMRQRTQSISNQLKRAVAVIQAEMATIGDTVLEVAVPLLKGLGDILKGFNALPKGIKLAGLALVGMTVGLGILYLVVGAVANLGNSLAVTIGRFIQARAQFKALTPAEIAARQEANRTTSAIDQQGTAAATAAQRISAYASALKQVAQVQAGIRTMTPVAGGPGASTAPTIVPPVAGPAGPIKTYGQAINGTGFATPGFVNVKSGASQANGAFKFLDRQGNTVYYNQGGFYSAGSNQTGRGGRVTGTKFFRTDAETGAVSRSKESNFRGAEQSVKEAEKAAIRANAEAKQIAANAAATRVSFLGVASAAAGLALLPMTMSTLSDESATFSQKMMMAGLAIGVMAPALVQIYGRVKLIAAAGMASGFKAMGTAVVGMLGPVGLVVAGIAAVGAAIYVINKRMGQWKKDMQAVNDSGKAWADIIGFTATEETQADKTGKSINVQAENVKKLKDNHEDLYKSLQKIDNMEDKIAAARREGIKALNEGANEDQVEQTMRTALAAMGVLGKSQDDAVKQIRLQIDINNPEQVKQQMTNDINKLMNDSLAEVSKQNWLVGLFTQDGISDAAKKAAGTAAGTFVSEFKAANGDTAKESDLFKGFVDQWNQQSQAAFTEIANKNKNKAIFATLGIKNSTDLSKQVELAQIQRNAMNPRSTGNIGVSEEKLKAATQGTNEVLAARRKLLDAAGGDAKNFAAQERVMAQEIARGANVQADQIDKIGNLDDLWKALGLTFNKTGSASGGAAGDINKATDAMDDLGDTTAKTSDELDDIRSKMVDALKDTMSNTMDSVYQSFADKREAQENAALDRIEASGQARIDKLDAAEEAKQSQFDARQEASDNDFKNRNKALDAAQKAESKKFEDDWDKVMDDHDKRFDDQKKAAENAADAQIQAIQDQIDAEEKADDIRQRIFEAQQARVQRMAEMFNNSIDFNAALNSGNLDEAARVQNNASATALGWAADDTAATAGDASKAKRDALTAQQDDIKKQKDATLDRIDEEEKADQKRLDNAKDRMKDELQARQDAASERLKDEQDTWNKSLKQERDTYSKSISNQKEAVQKQVDNQKNAAQDKFKAEDASIQLQLQALKAYTPRNEQELNDHISRLQGIYNSFGTNYIQPTGKSWGQVFGNEMQASQAAAAAALRNEINWGEIAGYITDQFADAIDLTGDGLINWLKNPTVNPFGAEATASAGKAYGGRSSSAGGAGGHGGTTAFHTGGGPGWSSADRVGVPRSASLYPSETPAILKRGEYVMNERATRANLPALHAMNQGTIVRHSGGGADITSGGGFGSLIGAMFAKAMVQGIQNALTQTVMAKAGGGVGVGAPGKYGGKNLDAEQLQNASIIMNVGNSMGASNRDLIIALMTAMQESSLRNLNYGDRDSLGLFQQRPSQGWGTAAQITNPQYAAKKFFETLFKVKGRDSLSLNDAAQKVQRSGTPNAYAKWEAMAEAIVGGTPMILGAAFGQGQAAGMTQGLSIKGGQTYPAMEALLKRSGVPEQVTATTNGKHAQGSYHYKGQAVDFDDFASPRVDTPGLFAIWKWIYDNFGSRSSELIYAGPGAVSIKDGRPHQYSQATMAAHHNHVHWAMSPSAMASIGIPQLAVGGNIKYDNTLANLHKGEAVLTAPLTSDLSQGIQNFKNGGGASYEINIVNPVLANPGDDDRLVRKVITALKDTERRTGRGTKIGG